MEKIFRPKRGTKSLAEKQLTGNNALKAGEIFFEIPDTGEGTNGNYAIKMGDGSTAYKDLPYILSNDAINIANEAKSTAETANNTANNASTVAVNVSNNLQYYQPFGEASALDHSKIKNANDFRSGITLVNGWFNMPSSDWYMLVSSGTSGTQVQLAFKLWDGSKFWRYCASGNWSNWNATDYVNAINDLGALSVASSATFASWIKTAYGVNVTTSAATNCYISTDGIIAKTSKTSSRRFKEDIKPVENKELDPHKILDIDVVQFKYKKDYFTNKEDIRYRKDLIGFIAEDVYNKYPIAADYEIDEDGNVVVNTWNEQYIIPAMLKLLQEQEDRISNLERDLYELKEKLS